jgi:Zn-dependent protease
MGLARGLGHSFRIEDARPNSRRAGFIPSHSARLRSRKILRRCLDAEFLQSDELAAQRWRKQEQSTIPFMRSWSLPIGKILGADLRLHATFLALLAFVVVKEWQEGPSMERAVALGGILLVSVLLHELAHLAVAALAGVPPRVVLMLPIGGIPFGFAIEAEAVAGTRWQREVRVALAGPAISLALALFSGMLLAILAPGLPLWKFPLVDSAALARSFFWINLSLGAFNLLPAYPLDGGRILRALLARRFPGTRATRSAAALGHVFTFIFIVAGYWLPWLVVLGAFLLLASLLEDRKLAFDGVLEQVRVADVMLTDFAILSPADTLQDALAKAVHTLQDDFPVVRGSDLVGTISRQGILRALRSEGDGYVQSAMNRAFEIAETNEPLARAFRKIVGRQSTLIPVVDEDRLVGIVTMQNLLHSMSLLAQSPRKLNQEED